MSTKQTVYEPKANTIYKLDLQGSLVEQAQDNPLELLFGNAEKQLGVSDVIKAIRNARMNPNIAGIYLNAGNLSAGFASLESIREELKAFKAADKFIVAYADNYTQGTYYLASVADSLFLNPQGTVGLTGLASQGLFFTGLGDKLGIHYEIFKAGKYKSAVEPYMLDKFSAENREQLTSLLNNIWYHWLENIAKDRNTTTGDLNRYANEGRALGEAQNALQFRLADRLCYRFEAENCAKRMVGQPDAEEMRSASTSKLLSMNTYDSTGPDKIAVVYAEGTIMSDANNEGYLETLVSEDIISDLRNLTEKNLVQAEDGTWWIHSARQKTGTPFHVPLLELPLELIEKYRGITKNGRLFPMLSCSKTNINLKKIAAICGINRRVTFHQARHTYASVITLSQGVPLDTVRELMGHRDWRATRIYAHLTYDKVNEDMGKLQKRITDKFRLAEEEHTATVMRKNQTSKRMES